MLGETGTVNLTDNFVTELTSTFFSPVVGWIVAIAAIVIMFALAVLGRARRRRAGLSVGPLRNVIARLVVIAAGIVAATIIFNQDRGLPLAVLILLGLTVLFVYITEQTRFGRHIFAVGGNAEAARRSGIRIDRVRVVVFVLSSTLAATGGILAASRLLAVNQSSGGSDLLLSAIAGPVIAGHQPVRRPWLRVVGAAGGARHRLHRQRHEPAVRVVVGALHGHRRRADGRRHARGRDAAARAGRRSEVARP